MAEEWETIMDALYRLPQKEQNGSRPRCLLLTEGTAGVVAERLNEVVARYARTDSEKPLWMPQGFREPLEARLGECPNFLTRAQRDEVRAWWLAVIKPTTNTPNWDMVAKATFDDGREGLVLVEAKAHVHELSTGGKPFRKDGPKASNPENHDRIGVAIAEANAALNAIEPGFAISRDSHYQLSNRFAWAWKVASMGVPVVLVYLGFLNCKEMRKPFASAEDWDSVMRGHANGVIPEVAWDKELMVAGTPMRAIIRSHEISLPLRQTLRGAS